MTKALRRLLVAVAVAALMMGGLGVGSASAVVDNDISTSYAHSTAYRVGNGSGLRFYGALQSKGANQCYEMQYKTPAGNWTTAGFWISENRSVEPLIDCTNDQDEYTAWSIHDGLDVRGIRFTNGVNTGTHCDTADNCRAMYP